MDNIIFITILAIIGLFFPKITKYFQNKADLERDAKIISKRKEEIKDEKTSSVANDLNSNLFS